MGEQTDFLNRLAKSVLAVVIGLMLLSLVLVIVLAIDTPLTVGLLVPIGLAVVGVLVAFAGNRLKRRVVRQLDNSPPVQAILNGREVKTKGQAEAPDLISYWWTVHRVGADQLEEVEVTKEAFDASSLHGPVYLYEYPGTKRLVHRDKIRGRPRLLNIIGVLMITGGTLWFIVDATP